MSDSQHSARVLGGRPLGPIAPVSKWAWDCAQCGAWSGYRYKSVTSAEAAALKHNTATPRSTQFRRAREHCGSCFRPWPHNEAEQRACPKFAALAAAVPTEPARGGEE